MFLVGDLVGDDDGFGDVVADEVGGDQTVDVGFVKVMTDVLTDAGENYRDPFTMAAFDQDFEIVYTGGVDEGHFPHSDDTHEG